MQALFGEKRRRKVWEKQEVPKPGIGKVGESGWKVLGSRRTLVLTVCRGRQDVSCMHAQVLHAGWGERGWDCGRRDYAF